MVVVVVVEDDSPLSILSPAVVSAVVRLSALCPSLTLVMVCGAALSLPNTAVLLLSVEGAMLPCPALPRPPSPRPGVVMLAVGARLSLLSPGVSDGTGISFPSPEAGTRPSPLSLLLTTGSRLSLLSLLVTTGSRLSLLSPVAAVVLLAWPTLSLLPHEGFVTLSSRPPVVDGTAGTTLCLLPRVVFPGARLSLLPPVVEGKGGARLSLLPPVVEGKGGARLSLLPPVVEGKGGARLSLLPPVVEGKGGARLSLLPPVVEGKGGARLSLLPPVVEGKGGARLSLLPPVVEGKGGARLSLLPPVVEGKGGARLSLLPPVVEGKGGARLSLLAVDLARMLVSRRLSFSSVRLLMTWRRILCSPLRPPSSRFLALARI